MSPVDLTADVAQGFDLREGAAVQLCYVTSLKIGDVELDADITVKDPESDGFRSDLQVVGISSFTGWTTMPTDPVNVVTQVSETAKNRLYAVRSKPNNVDFKFACYNYDPAAKRYFKSFHTGDTTMLGMVAGGEGDLKIHLQLVPSRAVKERRLYELSIGIAPRTGEAKQQALRYAESVLDKLVMQWGIGESQAGG